MFRLDLSLNEFHITSADTSFRALSLTSLVFHQLNPASSPFTTYTISFALAGLTRFPTTHARLVITELCTMSYRTGDPYANLHRERYSIAHHHDHVLLVLPSSINIHFVNGAFEERRGPPHAAYEFEVSLEALHKIAYFRRTLPLDKAAYGTSELRDDDPRAWKLWLEMVHGRLDEQSYHAQISTIWHVLRIADKYAINPRCDDAGR